MSELIRKATGLHSPLWSGLHTGLWSPFSGSALAGGGSAPLIDPATLYTGGKKGIWIKPRDWTTLRQSYLGTTNVTASTDPVGYAADQSGRGNHMVNANALGRPLAATVGSVNCVDFDGTDDALATSGTSAGFITGMDYFLVVYLDALASTIAAYSNPGGFLGVAQNGSASSTVSSAGSPSYKINGVAVPGGTSATRDQLYDALSSGGWIIVEANAATLTTWADFHIGGYAGFQINGKVAEFILCESVDDATRARIRTYLGSHVGLTL